MGEEQGRVKEGLIAQNPRDRICTQIQQQADVARAVREEEKRRAVDERMHGAKKRFARTFLNLSYQYFNLAESVVRSMSDEELLALEGLVARRAFGRSVVSRALSWNPIGLAVLAINNALKAMDNPSGGRHSPKVGMSWSYRYIRGKLKGAYGKNWFPFNVVRRGY